MKEGTLYRLKRNGSLSLDFCIYIYLDSYSFDIVYLLQLKKSSSTILLMHYSAPNRDILQFCDHYGPQGQSVNFS